MPGRTPEHAQLPGTALLREARVRNSRGDPRSPGWPLALLPEEAARGGSGMKDGRSFEMARLQQRPDLADRFGMMGEGAWPRFLLHADTLYWGSLFDEFAGFQFAFVDPEGAVIAIGHTVPFVWDGTEEDLPLKLSGVLGRALEDRRRGREPNALSA